MNINTTRTNTHVLYESSLAKEDVDESFDSEQREVKSFSKKRWAQDKSSALIKRIRGLGCILTDCCHRKASQSIPERKVCHWVTTDGFEALDEARDRVSETFTAEEVAKRFRNTIENLIHTLRYDEIAMEYHEDDQREKVTGIFIDFILCQEGLVHDRCFTVESSADKYVAGKTMSQERIKEIESCLNVIFTEQAAEASKFDKSSLRYSLGDMLVDYLNKKEKVPDDVTPKIKVTHDFHIYEITYKKLLKEIYPFFQTLLAGKGFFSELGLVFNCAAKYRQELIDSACVPCKTGNLLTIGLRLSKSDVREYFNRHVMDVIFSGRCDGIVSAMFDSCSLTDNEAEPANRPNLKLGEELEYDVKNKFSRTQGRLCNGFSSRLKEKGMVLQASNDKRGPHFGFDNSFTVVSFYDSEDWFEINCTPYHTDDQRAKLSFQKVIEATDSMRKEGLIDYSSGHKHVDAMSATEGDTSVLLAMESEIQRNPFLLRAFGNNDRILEDDEARWYKTFADYNPDTKPFAVKRLNRIIDRYNKKIEENYTEKPSHKVSTDSENKDRLEEFAHFYSQLVHMTTIQKGIGFIGGDIMGKFMAMSLLHITGASGVNKLSTLEFRFFRCPKSVQEIELINQFLQAWFQYIHQCRKDKIPLQPVPEDIQSSKDYTAAEVQLKTIDYLSKLGLNPEHYRCFWGEVRDIPSATD
ncbi:hypothetical protein [Endozoicomonas sp. 8E]|uniref:hypothetical protein n=1 Tax=Endozoicomonas sp. 8E TaxID=3035692 RepID=UPI00293931BE|nr:hypothetical protein [Endozoicomonas sp. 8E]WOG28128.1 hypothetical protein P6910_00310 [Endozoicomonas sp. 8E]